MPVLQVLFDLLSSSPGTPDDLTIVDEGGVTAVKGLSQVQVQSEAEALALLFEGKRNETLLHAPFLHHVQGCEDRFTATHTAEAVLLCSFNRSTSHCGCST